VFERATTAQRRGGELEARPVAAHPDQAYAALLQDQARLERLSARREPSVAGAKRRVAGKRRSKNVVSERLVQRASAPICASLNASAVCTTASGLPLSGSAEKTLTCLNGLLVIIVVMCPTRRISCGVRAPAPLAVSKSAARRQLHAHVRPPVVPDRH